MNSHQPEIIAIDVLGHSIEGLQNQKNKSIRQRYDELCINIAFYETKLQNALTTSQNFKEGLDAAIKALQDLKKKIDKLPEVARSLNELREEARQFKVSM